MKDTKTKRVVLLDAHAILHRAYHALPDFSTSKGEPTGALYGLSAMLIKIIEDLKPDYMIACYDLPGPTYRHAAYTAYKAGRQKTDSDLVTQIIRSRDIFKALNVPIYDKQGFEADDIIGTISEKIAISNTPERAQLEIIIASGDMDTLQLVKGDIVKVYTLKKGINDTIMYDEDAVRERFGFGPELVPDYKGLRGDPSDNIIGIKGIGEKTATTIIHSFGTIENMYKELEAGYEQKFKKAGLTPRIIKLIKDNKEEAEFSKMLATIRRDAPIDFVLPVQTFKGSLDMVKIKALWNELEFRTLPQRFEKTILSSSVNAPSAGIIHAPVAPAGENSLPRSVSERGRAVLPERARLESSSDEIEKLGIALWLIHSDTTNPKLEDITNFAGTEDFAQARDKIMKELDAKGLRKVYEDIELPLVSITHHMEEKGVKINRAELKYLSEKYHARLSELELEIWKHAGKKFNINSPKQLGEILFDILKLTGKNMKKTDGGARSTRESELEKLRDAHPIVPLLFEYRELQKLLSTYIDAIPPLLDSADRLHTDFIIAGSTTGRMASQNPGIQNIPVKTELGRAIRKAFVAEKDFVLVSFDYSQIELRIAAFLSGDEKMIEIFRRDDDIHTSVASFVFKVNKKDVTADMRRQAKVINFGIIYGMGINALRSNLGSDRATAQKFYDDYFREFSGLARYLEKTKSDTVAKGYTETYFGRRRYFDGIRSRIPYVRAQAERMTINAPIQGTGADIIKLAMIGVDKYINDKNLTDDVFLVLQVHDELVCEVRRDIAESFAMGAKAVLESIIKPDDIHGIVLKAEYHVGDNWGELK